MRGLSSISNAMVCDKSPFATARITLAVSEVGCTKSVIRVLTEFTLADQEPSALPMVARWAILPSLPTTVLMRSSSAAIL